MILAEAPTMLDGLASAASVLLIIELSLIIFLLAALMLLLALSLRWVHDHLVPPLQEYMPVVRGALGNADRATGQVVDLVADLYARRKRIEETLRSFVESSFPALSFIFGDDAPPPHTHNNGHSPNGHGPTPTPPPPPTAAQPPVYDRPTTPIQPQTTWRQGPMAQFDPLHDALDDTIVMRRQPRPQPENEPPTAPNQPYDEDL